MKAISTEIQYERACERIEELLPLVTNQTPETDKNFVELDLLSGLVEDYEKIHYPIEYPSFQDIIRLRMAERKLNQQVLADILEVSPSRLSGLMNGKVRPTFEVAQKIHRKLGIDGNIILNSPV